MENPPSICYRWFYPRYKPPFVGDSQPKTFDCQRLPQPLHEISLHPHAENSPTSSHTAWWIVTAKMSLWRKHGGPCRGMSSQSPASLAGGEATDPHSLVSSNVAGESSTKLYKVYSWEKTHPLRDFHLLCLISRMCKCFGKYWWTLDRSYTLAPPISWLSWNPASMYLRNPASKDTQSLQSSVPVGDVSKNSGNTAFDVPI